MHSALFALAAVGSLALPTHLSASSAESGIASNEFPVKTTFDQKMQEMMSIVEHQPSADVKFTQRVQEMVDFQKQSHADMHSGFSQKVKSMKEIKKAKPSNNWRREADVMRSPASKHLVSRVRAMVNSEEASPAAKNLLRMADQLADDKLHTKGVYDPKQTSKNINPNSPKAVWEAYTKEFAKEADMEEAHLKAETQGEAIDFDKTDFIKMKQAELKNKWAKQDKEVKIKILKLHLEGRTLEEATAEAVKNVYGNDNLEAPNLEEFMHNVEGLELIGREMLNEIELPKNTRQSTGFIHAIIEAMKDDKVTQEEAKTVLQALIEDFDTHYAQKGILPIEIDALKGVDIINENTSNREGDEARLFERFEDIKDLALSGNSAVKLLFGETSVDDTNSPLTLRAIIDSALNDTQISSSLDGMTSISTTEKRFIDMGALVYGSLCTALLAIGAITFGTAVAANVRNMKGKRPHKRMTLNGLSIDSYGLHSRDISSELWPVTDTSALEMVQVPNDDIVQGLPGKEAPHLKENPGHAVLSSDSEKRLLGWFAVAGGIGMILAALGAAGHLVAQTMKSRSHAPRFHGRSAYEEVNQSSSLSFAISDPLSAEVIEAIEVLGRGVPLFVGLGAVDAAVTELAIDTGISDQLQFQESLL